MIGNPKAARGKCSGCAGCGSNEHLFSALPRCESETGKRHRGLHARQTEDAQARHHGFTADDRAAANTALPSNGSLRPRPRHARLRSLTRNAVRELSVLQRMPSLELKSSQTQSKGQLIFHGGLALFTFNKRENIT